MSFHYPYFGSSVKIPKFSGDGKEDFDSWLAYVKRYLNQSPKSMAQQVDIVVFALTGSARNVIANYDDFTTVDQIIDTLRIIFAPKLPRINSVVHAKQGPVELSTIFMTPV